MILFVDTSALLAILDQEDIYHLRAETAWQQFIVSGTALVTTSYIVVEATALIQRRLSVSAVKVLVEEILPAINIDWIHPAVHQEGIE